MRSLCEDPPLYTRFASYFFPPSFRVSLPLLPIDSERGFTLSCVCRTVFFFCLPASRTQAKLTYDQRKERVAAKKDEIRAARAAEEE